MIENIDGEIWKDIKGYEGFYMISSFGRVKSLNRTVPYMAEYTKLGIKHHTTHEKIKKPFIDEDGYYRIKLHKNGQHNNHRVHGLVAKAFIPNPNNLAVVHHIDDNPANNIVSNLIWVTSPQNTKLAVEHGLILHGSKHPCSKLTEEQVIEIRKIYKNNSHLSPIAKKYNVREQTIWAVVKRKTWKHI